MFCCAPKMSIKQVHSYLQKKQKRKRTQSMAKYSWPTTKYFYLVHASSQLSRLPDRPSHIWGHQPPWYNFIIYCNIIYLYSNIKDIRIYRFSFKSKCTVSFLDHWTYVIIYSLFMKSNIRSFLNHCSNLQRRFDEMCG